jgi:hypothetical protein
MRSVLLLTLGSLSLTVLGVWFFGWGMWSMMESNPEDGYSYDGKSYEYTYDGLKMLVDDKMLKITNCIENTYSLNNTERERKECFECSVPPSVWNFHNSYYQWILELSQKFDLTDSDQDKMVEYTKSKFESLPECKY